MAGIKRKHVIEIIVLILTALFFGFYGTNFLNKTVYYYHYLLGNENFELGVCKIRTFNGWALYEHEKNILKFINLDSNGLSYFWASIKHEDTTDIDPIILNGYSIIGRYKKISENRFDYMYYFPDFKIKVSIENQTSINNDLIENFSKSLTCKTA